MSSFKFNSFLNPCCDWTWSYSSISSI